MTTKLNDKATLKQLRDALNYHLELVANEFGLKSLTAGRISYDSDGIGAKITVQAVAEREDGKTKEVVDFEKYCEVFGLKPEHLGQVFHAKSGTYTVAGLMPNRRKFPVLGIEMHTNKRMLFTTDVVKQLVSKDDSFEQGAMKQIRDAHITD